MTFTEPRFGRGESSERRPDRVRYVRLAGLGTMAQAIKSVLLLDFDSVFRSLGRHGAAVADQFASRAGVWLEGFESGELIGEGGTDERRRFQLKRCYADPKILGKNRGWLTANGVQIVECAQLAGITRSSSATHLILDALDTIEPEPEELILLVADIDLTPLVFRLKARRQRVVLYATAETPPSYRALADDVVEEAALLRALQRQPEIAASSRGAIPRPPRMAAPEPKRVAPPAAPAPAARRTQPLPAAAAPARRPPVDRDALAALVRRIHQATSVPLFSPKAFGDLFRLLVEEVRANGYKFQSTSENVANGMNALGRNVTKRQVGFVIKGLALRGHVFGGDDRPEQLAEAFYEQVLFLSDNAKVILTEPEKGLVLAWVVGLRREEPAPPPPPPVEAPRAAVPPLEAPRTAAVPPPPPMPRAPRAGTTTRPPAATPARRREVEAVRPAVTEPAPTPAPAPARVVRAEPPTRPARSTETPARTAAAARAQPAPPPTIDDIIPEAPEPIVAPPPAAERPRPTARSTFAARTTQNSAGASLPERRPRTERPPEPVRREAEFEDSILSAIADAVDVLADDPPAQPAAEPAPSTARPAPRSPARAAAPAPAPAEPLPPSGEADEIGDEIQRILASYSQNR